ncbi:hypothetical protein BKH41_05490 [Helicobacter sp. 12S02232-10]|nr:hypothetical protein BKH41_05490 [Helicobacter sp. 12S02232-10]
MSIINSVPLLCLKLIEIIPKNAYEMAIFNASNISKWTLIPEVNFICRFQFDSFWNMLESGLRSRILFFSLFCYVVFQCRVVLKCQSCDFIKLLISK